MNAERPTTELAAQGVAAELLKVWKILNNTTREVGHVLGLSGEPPFDVTSVGMTRIEVTESGERMVAPVSFADLRPVTSLFMDMRVDLEGKQVTILSQVYIDEQLKPAVMVTEIPEFEILPEDVEDGSIAPEAIEKIRELLKRFPLMTSGFLEVLIQTRVKNKNEERKG